MNDKLTKPGKASQIRKWLLGALGLAVLVGLCGCNTLKFYGQAIKGQYQLFAHQEPISRLIQDPATPQRLKTRLEFVEQLRAFAAAQLKLPVDGHYRKYVDVHRRFVVWNVEAAPEFSMQPKTWWYPLVGSLEYRGYFSKPAATNYAHALVKKGLDVSVGGVTAYSTLGWFKDPVLNTFVFEPDSDLAEVIFHELGHQRLFARGDTDFNEAFATTVGEEGARRWLKTKADTAGLDEYLAHLRRNDKFVHLVMNTRARLESLYGDELTAEGKVRAGKNKPSLPPAELRRQKERVLADMKAEYEQLKAAWGGNPEYDGWFHRPLNNSDLNSIAAYYDFVPGFEQILARNGGDLEKFYAAASELAKKPKPERHQELRLLASVARQQRQAAAATH